MKTALLASCLGLPLIAYAAQAGAAQPDRGHYVYVPASATAVILPGPGAGAARIGMVPMGDGIPFARLIAQQESLMRRMMADFDSMMSMPDPRQMIQAVMDGHPGVMPGSGVVMTSINTGKGSCNETVTYGYPANGGQPRVNVTRTGDACDAVPSAMPSGATTPARDPEVVPGRTAPKLWTVSNPPQPIVAGRPRS